MCASCRAHAAAQPPFVWPFHRAGQEFGRVLPLGLIAVNVIAMRAERMPTSSLSAPESLDLFRFAGFRCSAIPVH